MALEVNEQNINNLAFYLEKTLSPDAATRKQAELGLAGLRSQSGYGLIILKLIQMDTVPMNIRKAAATLFKNFVKLSWEETTISAADKKQIREILPPFMLAVPKPLQKLISASLKLISDIDFPANWPDLLPGLVKQLQSTNDYTVINGIMKVLSSIFKRYRYQFSTDAVLTQMKYILQTFAPTLLHVFNLTCQQIDTHANNAQAQVILFTSLKIICDIFYSLNSVDLPEEFEDNMGIWMSAFLKFLNYDTKIEGLLVSGQEDSPGLLHKVQASIIASVNLYIEKYEEEFKDYLPNFVTAIWNLLMKTPNKPKYDPLVTSSIQFLTSISRSTFFNLFEGTNVLGEICKNIVIPNIKLRKSDLFLFEDDPMEYVRRDVEGSDTGTRRRSAYELVKGLRKNFEKQVTAIFATHITEMLTEYAADPVKNWTSKDAAIYLLSALAVTRASTGEGVTLINQSVPIRDFYNSQILPELQVSDINQQPVLKASCLNFINSFRRQFSSEDFQVLLPLFVTYIGSNNFVVHSQASMCVDRFLLVRDKTEQGTNFRFGRQFLKPHLGNLLHNLFATIGPTSTVENHFVMKATARVFSIAKEDTLPFIEESLNKLNQKLVTIYKAPSNPDFGYYLFETLANAISLFFKHGPSSVDRIEQLLFPVFQKILVEPGSDVFSPFVFQLMSILLETRGKLPDVYKPLLKELTTPLFWEQQGNVPALTRLLQAYITTGPDFVVSSKLLLNILGVFQKLVSSKINDYLGFYLLQSIVEHVPCNDFSFALPDVFKIIFIRVQGSKTGQLVKGFIVFLSIFIGKYSPKFVIDQMSMLQPGIFGMVLQSLWIPNVEGVKGKIERKACSIAMTKLLCEWPEVLAPPFVDIWPKLLQQTVHLFEGLEAETVVTQEDIFNEDSERGGHYTSGFSDLHHAARTEVDPFKDINPKVFFAQSLKNLLKADPAKVSPLVSSIGEQYTNALRNYFESAGITI